MLRHVVVLLEELATSRSPVWMALTFAKAYRGTVTGLYVRPPEPLALSADAPFRARLAVAGVDAEIEGESYFEEVEDERQVRLVRNFERAARQAEVPFRIDLREGRFAAEVEAAARCADVLVVARDEAEAGRVGSPLEWLVRRVPHPVLVASGTGRPLRRLAVAYDGSLGARRALAAAADIAVNAVPRVEEVVLIQVGSLARTDGAHLLEASRYLELYGVPRRTISVLGRASERLIALTEREDVDLLCMGAYGHWAIREVLLGSTTHEVVKHYTRPILLCH